MTASTANNKFEQVIQKIDPQSKLLRTWELKGDPLADVANCRREILWAFGIDAM